MPFLNNPKPMKPGDNLALILVKPEYISRIATTKNKPTRTSTKSFIEIIQDKSMAITTCDYNLGFFGMVIQASDLNPLKNVNPLLSMPSEQPLKSLK